MEVGSIPTVSKSTKEGIVTSLNWEQPLKMPTPVDFTEGGITNSSNSEQWLNA